jgi:Polyketide cyclase / dehydrase and lipid transport
MRHRHINVRARTEANPATVYSLLTYGPGWPTWSPIESFELEAVGDPPPEGPGAIRVFRRGRTTGRDQVTGLVPDEQFSYRSLSGLPVRDDAGELTLVAEPAGGTIIYWHSSFFAKAPGIGWLIERSIRTFLQQCVDGLAEHAGEVAESPIARRTLC